MIRVLKSGGMSLCNAILNTYQKKNLSSTGDERLAILVILAKDIQFCQENHAYLSGSVT